MKPKARQKKYKAKNPIQDAIEYGIDVTLLYEREDLSPTERIERHQQALEFVEELRRAGKNKHDKS
ncbi:MAG: hypothetical protein HY097_04290 [Nitrospinae bacterium]|nr:hypothetical protein [Nitrospinota bacterium]MBI3815324.1 hypothetical protein [Nitrospinota bacterium]